MQVFIMCGAVELSSLNHLGESLNYKKSSVVSDETGFGTTKKTGPFIVLRKVTKHLFGIFGSNIRKEDGEGRAGF